MVYVIQIEGNIGVGKSTLINYLKSKLSKNHKIIFINEPINTWMNIEGYNLFHLYYTQRKKYSELFQYTCFMTQLHKSLKTNYKENQVIVMERSLYTNVHCFDKLLLDKKLVRPIHHSCLIYFLNLFNDKILQPNIIIYFKVENTDIPLLQNRIKKRDRLDEANISNDYLIKLNDIYNNVINQYNIKKIEIPINI